MLLRIARIFAANGKHLPGVWCRCGDVQLWVWPEQPYMMIHESAAGVLTSCFKSAYFSGAGKTRHAKSQCLHDYRPWVHDISSSLTLKLVWPVCFDAKYCAVSLPHYAQLQHSNLLFFRYTRTVIDAIL